VRECVGVIAWMGKRLAEENLVILNSNWLLIPIITVASLNACVRPLLCGFVHERHAHTIVGNNASRPDHEAHECISIVGCARSRDAH